MAAFFKSGLGCRWIYCPGLRVSITGGLLVWNKGHSRLWYRHNRQQTEGSSSIISSVKILCRSSGLAKNWLRESGDLNQAKSQGLTAKTNTAKKARAEPAF